MFGLEHMDVFDTRLRFYLTCHKAMTPQFQLALHPEAREKLPYLQCLFFFNFYFYFILLYNTVLVLPYIDMNPLWVYMHSQT